MSQPEKVEQLNTKMRDLSEALARPIGAQIEREQRAEYAEAMGKDPSEISFLRFDWSRLMQRGGIGSVTFRYWRATKSLELEDIGLTPRSAEEREALLRVLKVPQGRLLVGTPGIAELRQQDSKGRGWLKAYSEKTQLGAFIRLGEKDPEHERAGWHMREFESGMEQIGQDFFAIGSDIVSDWDSLQRETIGYWDVMANELFENLVSQGKLLERGKYPTMQGDPDDFPSRREWVEWFLDTRIRPDIITPEEFRKRLRFKWAVRPLLPPQALLKAQADAALDDAELELRQLFIAKAGDTIDIFYRDVVGLLRERLLDVTSNALAAMKRPKNAGRLPAPNQTAIRSLIEYVERVKTWPDDDIERQIGEMRAALELSPDTRADPKVSEELQSMFRRIAAEAKLTLFELDRADDLRSTRDLGIPDDDDAELELLANRKRRNIPALDELDGEDLAINRSSRGRKLE